MKCSNCGFENQQNFEYCVNCGTEMPKVQSAQTEPVGIEPVSLNPAADKVMNALKDSMFLVLCILMSVSCVMSIAIGNVPLLNILITVFLWLTYADANKGFASENHLRSVSGTVYASYIITNVACGILIACGVLLGVMNSVIDGADILTELLVEFGISGISSDMSDLMSQEMLGHIGIVLAIVFVLIAVICLVINLLGMKKIHRFAKSVYMGIMFQNPNFENSRAAKNWLLFFGICSAISAMTSLAGGSVVATLATGCSAASAIIASILIDKYLVSENYYTA